MTKTTFVVADNNTFGYTFDSITDKFCTINIMAVSSIRGGDPLLIHNSILRTNDRIRIATSNDFTDYRISEKGFRDNCSYIYDRLQATL